MLNEDHEKYMRAALDEAKKAYNKLEIPIGAVITCNGKIIARAHNQTELLNDVTAHAEIIAITSAANHIGAKYLINCNLYVSLEPCIMCAGAIAWSQIPNLIYGAKDEKKGFYKLKDEIFNKNINILQGVLETECETIIKEFFIKLRNQKR